MEIRNGFALPISAALPDVEDPTSDAQRMTVLIAQRKAIGITLSIPEAHEEVSGRRDLDAPTVRAGMMRVRVAERAAIGITLSNLEAHAELEVEITADAPRRAGVLTLLSLGNDPLILRLAADGHTSRGEALSLLFDSVSQNRLAEIASEEARVAAGLAHADLMHAAAIAKRAQAFSAAEAKEGRVVFAAEAVAHITRMDQEATAERERLAAVAAEDRAREAERRRTAEAASIARIVRAPTAPAISAPAAMGRRFVEVRVPPRIIRAQSY